MVPFFYKATGKASGYSYKDELDKVAFGTYMGASGEYRITENLGARLKLSITAGQVNIGNVMHEEKQNVSNLMLTGLISFRTK